MYLERESQLLIQAKDLRWGSPLAGVGTGVYKNVAQACDAAIKVDNVQQVEIDRQQKYTKLYGIYRQLYKSLKNDYKALHEIMSEVYEGDL